LFGFEVARCLSAANPSLDSELSRRIGQSAILAKTGDPDGARQLRERAPSDDRTLIEAFSAHQSQAVAASKDASY